MGQKQKVIRPKDKQRREFIEKVDFALLIKGNEFYCISSIVKLDGHV